MRGATRRHRRPLARGTDITLPHDAPIRTPYESHQFFDMGIEVVTEPMAHKFVPDDTVLERAREWGRGIAEEMARRIE